MIFWSSCEIHRPAFENFVAVDRLAAAHISTKFAELPLAKINLQIRYVPIVMPLDMHDRYRERSKALIKQRIMDCAPHLSFKIFTSADRLDQFREYGRGLATCLDRLKRFDISSSDIDLIAGIFTSCEKLALH